MAVIFRDAALGSKINLNKTEVDSRFLEEERQPKIRQFVEKVYIKISKNCKFCTQWYT